MKTTLAAVLALATLTLSPRSSLAAVPAPEPAPAPPTPATPDTSNPLSAQEDDPAAKQAEARQFFERGLLLFEKGAYDAALGEFSRSRKTMATRAATKYAAACLRALQRYDEALDLFEEVLTFPSLSERDRAYAEQGVRDVSAKVGSLTVQGGEPGMSVVVDGKFRGTLPMTTPLRVAAGSHEVGAFKEGRDPFGATIEIVARKGAVATLRSVAKGGRLKVTEQQQRTLDVILDGAVVGKTPWEGAVSVGEHYVALRGNVSSSECPIDPAQPSPPPHAASSVEVGTQPVTVPIKLRELTALTLLAEELDTVLRVEPMPGGAAIAVDSVVVGRGTWEGRLRVGEHKIEVMSEGFLPVERRIRLTRGKRAQLTVELDRDPNTPEWRAMRNRWAGAAFGFGAVGLGVFGVTGALALSKANDVKATCAGNVCAPSQVDNLNASHTYGVVATVGLVAGLVGIGTGTLILLTSRPSAAPKENKRPAGDVTFAAGLGPGSVRFAGTF